MCILPKAVYRLNAIPIKISMSFFSEIDKILLKFCVEPQKTPNNQSNPEKKNKAGGIRLPDSKTCYKKIGPKTT
jgi:hypothetical protein